MLRSGGRGLRFVIATSSRGKAKEFEKIFSEYGLRFRVEPMKTPELQAMDLKLIARNSVLYAYDVLREPVMVEDAGLFIHALKGFPGPFSSYVYKTIGIEGVLKLLEGVEDRRAKFISVIAFYSPITEPPRLFIGEVKGFISEKPRGSKGFGFDPIFIPAESDGRTFGEMEVDEKNRFSHRAKSAKMFAEWIKGLREPSPAYE